MTEFELFEGSTTQVNIDDFALIEKKRFIRSKRCPTYFFSLFKSKPMP